jgi:hypothetical protein
VDPHLVGDHAGLHSDIEQQCAQRQGCQAQRTAEAAKRKESGRRYDPEQLPA